MEIGEKREVLSGVVHHLELVAHGHEKMRKLRWGLTDPLPVTSERFLPLDQHPCSLEWVTWWGD